MTTSELRDFLIQRYAELAVVTSKKHKISLAGTNVKRGRKPGSKNASKTAKTKRRSAKQIRQESTELSALQALGLM